MTTDTKKTYLFDIYDFRKMLYLNDDNIPLGSILSKYIETPMQSGMKLSPNAHVYYKNILSILEDTPNITLSETKLPANIIFSECHSHTIMHILKNIIFDSVAVLRRFIITEGYTHIYDIKSLEMCPVYQFAQKMTTLDETIINENYNWFYTMLKDYNSYQIEEHRLAIFEIYQEGGTNRTESLIKFLSAIKIKNH